MSPDNTDSLTGRAGEATPPEHLEQLPRDELLTLALELGLSPEATASSTELAHLVQRRRQLLGELDRQAMIEVVVWGRRPVRASATKEELARQIARVTKMHFSGLSRQGLLTLAALRDVQVQPETPSRQIIRALRSREGLLQKLSRKRRRFVGKLLAGLLDGQQEQEYRFLPEERHRGSIKEQIEERGVIHGLADRLRGAADDYIGAKLDEIEARIDRKLDQIDRRLSEWRDREIQNRLRIIRITLIASVIVSIISVAYAWLVRSYFS